MPHQHSLCLGAAACKAGGLVSRSFSESCSRGKRRAVEHGVRGPFTGRGVAERPSLSCSLPWLCCCLAPAGTPGTALGASKSSGVSSCSLLVPSQHQNKCLLGNPAAESSCALTIDVGRRRCLFCRAGIFPDGLVERSTVWWLPLKMLCKLRTLPCCVTKQNRFRFVFFFIFRIILDIVVCQILWMANTQISQIKEIWSNGRLDHISFVVEIIVNGVKLWCWLFMQW